MGTLVQVELNTKQIHEDQEICSLTTDSGIEIAKLAWDSQNMQPCLLIENPCYLRFDGIVKSTFMRFIGFPDPSHAPTTFFAGAKLFFNSNSLFDPGMVFGVNGQSLTLNDCTLSLPDLSESIKFNFRCDMSTTVDNLHKIVFIMAAIDTFKTNPSQQT